MRVRTRIPLLALAALAACKGRPERPARPLPFLEDDYPGALAQARARGLPLFVDVWAPW